MSRRAENDGFQDMTEKRGKDARMNAINQQKLSPHSKCKTWNASYDENPKMKDLMKGKVWFERVN